MIFTKTWTPHEENNCHNSLTQLNEKNKTTHQKNVKKYLKDENFSHYIHNSQDIRPANTNNKQIICTKRRRKEAEKNMNAE